MQRRYLRNHATAPLGDPLYKRHAKSLARKMTS